MWAPRSNLRRSSPLSGIALMIACTTGLALGTFAEGCNQPVTPAMVKNDLTTALDLTQAACSVADTTGDAYVILACAITTTLENGAIQVATLFVPATASTAAVALAKHPESETSRALVVQFKALHPSANPLPR
jgi:hypothetical protein